MRELPHTAQTILRSKTYDRIELTATKVRGNGKRVTYLKREEKETAAYFN